MYFYTYSRLSRSLAKPALGALLACLSACLSASAWAGAFTVTPVRIYMNPQDRAIAVTVTNEGDEELVMQADLYEWKQKAGGEEDLVPTEDLFLSPPILKVAPKSRQVVRLARVKKGAPGGAELSYRMIVREIPEAKATPKDIQLQIALAFSMPVFITPPTAKANLGCRVERVAADKLQANCENTGNAHTHPVSLQLLGTGGSRLALQETGGYLLPGTKRSFELKRTDGNIAAGSVKVAVTLADGTTKTFDAVIGQ